MTRPRIYSILLSCDHPSVGDDVFIGFRQTKSGFAVDTTVGMEEAPRGLRAVVYRRTPLTWRKAAQTLMNIPEYCVAGDLRSWVHCRGQGMTGPEREVLSSCWVIGDDLSLDLKSFLIGLSNADLTWLAGQSTNGLLSDEMVSSLSDLVESGTVDLSSVRSFDTSGEAQTPFPARINHIVRAAATTVDAELAAKGSTFLAPAKPQDYGQFMSEWLGRHGPTELTGQSSQGSPTVADQIEQLVEALVPTHAYYEPWPVKIGRGRQRSGLKAWLLEFVSKERRMPDPIEFEPAWREIRSSSLNGSGGTSVVQRSTQKDIEE